jgi:hypothetical protein
MAEIRGLGGSKAYLKAFFRNRKAAPSEALKSLWVEFFMVSTSLTEVGTLLELKMKEFLLLEARVSETDRWFVVVGERTLGPFDREGLLERLRNHEITTAHYLWKEGFEDWVRFSELEEFKEIFPPKPPKQWISKLKAPTPPKELPRPREWFAFIKNTQEGPFDLDELKSMARMGTVDAQTYAWKIGMENWQLIGEIPELMKIIAVPPPVPPSPPPAPTKVQRAEPSPQVKDLPPNLKSQGVEAEKIQTQASPQSAPPQASTDSAQQAAPQKTRPPRIPIVARVLFHDNQLVGQGICRDLSIGGAQILLDTSQGESGSPDLPVGSVIKMNLHSDEVVGSDKKVVFTTDAVVVRHLSQERGFAVRFMNIEDEFANLIKSYVNQEVQKGQ